MNRLKTEKAFNSNANLLNVCDGLCSVETYVCSTFDSLLGLEGSFSGKCGSFHITPRFIAGCERSAVAEIYAKSTRNTRNDQLALIPKRDFPF